MEKVKREDIVTGVSIHSSRVSACIAVSGEDGEPIITGLGRAEGRLLGAKGVLNIDALSRAMRGALNAAEAEAGAASPKAFISVSGGSLNIEKSRGIIKLSQKGTEITDKNVRDVLKVADTVSANLESEIMHSIPQSFVVDGQKNVENPTGLYAVKLEVEALLVMAQIPFLQNVVKALNLAGVDMEDIVFSGIALSKCLLSQKTEDKGVALMEIDNNYTVNSLFYDNILKGIDVQEKSAISEGVLEAMKINLDKMRGEKPISKIILSGGGYIHEDFIERVNSIFGIPSSVAYARNIRGMAKDINNPAHLASTGLALYGFQKRRENLNGVKAGSTILEKISKSVGIFIEEYF